MKHAHGGWFIATTERQLYRHRKSLYFIISKACYRAEKVKQHDALVSTSHVHGGSVWRWVLWLWL